MLFLGKELVYTSNELMKFALEGERNIVLSRTIDQNGSHRHISRNDVDRVALYTSGQISQNLG